jgi:hypothetical protein
MGRIARLLGAVGIGLRQLGALLGLAAFMTVGGTPATFAQAVYIQCAL